MPLNAKSFVICLFKCNYDRTNLNFSQIYNIFVGYYIYSRSIKTKPTTLLGQKTEIKSQRRQCRTVNLNRQQNCLLDTHTHPHTPTHTHRHTPTHRPQLKLTQSNFVEHENKLKTNQSKEKKQQKEKKGGEEKTKKKANKKMTSRSNRMSRRGSA